MAWGTLVAKDGNAVLRSIVAWIDGSGNYSQAAAMVPAIPTVLGFESRTISTSVITITATTIPTGATHALASMEGGDARYRMDAGAASVSGTSGALLIEGQEYMLSNLSAIRLIRASYMTADVTLQIHYLQFGP